MSEQYFNDQPLRTPSSEERAEGKNEGDSLTDRKREERKEWKEIATAPNGIVLMTKIDDENGIRNEQELKRSGNLWFVPDGSMYVYYTPTHWRYL